MIPLRVTGKAGPAQGAPRGHRGMIMPISRKAPVRCGECPSCSSDLANLVPCQRGRG